jgi:hypothetical protein
MQGRLGDREAEKTNVVDTAGNWLGLLRHAALRRFWMDGWMGGWMDGGFAKSIGSSIHGMATTAAMRRSGPADAEAIGTSLGRTGEGGRTRRRRAGEWVGG